MKKDEFVVALGWRVPGFAIIELLLAEARGILLDGDLWMPEVEHNKPDDSAQKIILLKTEQVLKYPHLERRVKVTMQPIFPECRYPEIRILLEILGVPQLHFSRRRGDVLAHLEKGLVSAFADHTRSFFEFKTQIAGDKSTE